MPREPLDFSGNGGDIDSGANHGFMSAADISNDAWGEIMHGIVRYSFTIVAFFCVAVPAGERAFGQVPKGEVASHGTAQSTHEADTGRDLYIANCSACHQAGGEGLPGVFPPLKGSGVVNKDDAAKHFQVVLNGMQGARAGGVMYAAAMPPFAGALSDAEIADIIDYERSSWGNHGKPVTAAQVAAERTRPK
jgi:cytochrome c oxidase cbb3-type subunit 2